MMSRRMEDGKSVRINITLHGEPARWLQQWKRRGLVKSNQDAVIQAFRLMHERIIQHDLEEARLRTIIGSMVRRTCHQGAGRESF